MSATPLVLVNVLRVEPDRQADLIELLRRNIETVVTTLSGWRASRLIAAADGASVVIHSEWETEAAMDAMRSDPRMQADFPQILSLASIDTIAGEVVFSRQSS